MGLSASITALSVATSNLDPAGNRIYRDGGGGGTVNGVNIAWFSDGIFTRDGNPPQDNFSNWENFTSNTIAALNWEGRGLTEMFDFGDTQEGPREQIPYFTDQGEGKGSHGVWPNQNGVTLCDGHCAVFFPEVVDRRTSPLPTGIYNTPVTVELTAFGPRVTRGTRKLFEGSEHRFGTFCAYTGVDGYVYMYASLNKMPPSNGLKLARVPAIWYNVRAQYEYWDGTTWNRNINSAANVFHWSKQYDLFGTLTDHFGPGYGEVHWNPLSGTYVLLFMSAGAVFDNNVYISYSSKLEGPWTAAQAIGTLPGVDGGWIYSFHSYPNMDASGAKIPISWNEYRPNHDYRVRWGYINFKKNA